MTALYPSREDAELTPCAGGARAGQAQRGRLRHDGGLDRAPGPERDRGAQFPRPTSSGIRLGRHRRPDLRRSRRASGGAPSQAPGAARTSIRYATACSNGRGASLLDGYMEDLATDRIYRLMLAQRLRHHNDVSVAGDDGGPVDHTRAFVSAVFDESWRAWCRNCRWHMDAGPPPPCAKRAGRVKR